MRSVLCLMAVFGLLLAGAPSVPGQTSAGMDTEVLVDGLLQQLKSSKQGDRFEAILAIKKIGPGAKAAIPAIAEVASNDPEAALRELAKGCLDVIRQPILDGLLQQLKSSKQGDRFEAILAIKKIGPGAEAAIPALTEVASNDPEGALRELAKSCLDVIRQPQPIQSERIVVDFLKPIEVHLDVPITEEIRKARKVVGGDLYSVVTIHNKTKGPINYLYRWGNGNWNQAKLNPDNGMSYSHKYKFVNEHKSPSFEVQFDRNVSPTATWIVYKLERNPSPSRNPDFGRRYDFEQSNYNHIVLKERE